MTKSHLQTLKEIVNDLNIKGGNLVICNEHDDKEFIVLRVRERGPRRFYGLLPGKPERLVYETPVKSEGKWGRSNDPEITKALRQVYGNTFYVDHLQ